MPPVTKPKTKPQPVTIAEKLEIITFIQQKPKESYNNVANIFSVKFDKKINGMRVCRIYGDRLEIQQMPKCNQNKYACRK